MDVRRWWQVAKTHRDLLLAVTAAVAYVVELLGYPRADHAVAVPLAVIAGLGLGFRRRAPFVSFVVVTLANFGALHFSPGYDNNAIVFLLVFLLNLYSLGRYARGLESWAGVGGLLVSIITFVVGDGSHGVPDILFATAFCGIPWGAGLTMRLRREREEELSAANVRLEEQAHRAVADERSRIARELHDVVSHAISVTVLQSRGGRKMLGHDDEAVRRALDAIERTNTQALSDMRRLLSLLRDADAASGSGDLTARDEPQPSLDRLDALVIQVREAGVPVELDVVGDPVPVPPGVDLSAYRIIQEALTNVLKHAGPQARARVEVRYGADDLDVTVRSSGPTTPSSDGLPGHGLLGIRERVAVVGGDIEAGPVDGGYVVRARLPYGVLA